MQLNFNPTAQDRPLGLVVLPPSRPRVGGGRGSRRHLAVFAGVVTAVVAIAVAVGINAGTGAPAAERQTARERDEATAAPAVDQPAQPQASAPRPVVRVIGDSLVAQAATGSPLRPDPNPRRFGAVARRAGWDATIEGHPGFTAAQLDQLGIFAPTRGVAAVVAVFGSNEAKDLALGATSVDQIRAEWDRVLQQLRGVTCVVIPNVVAGPTGYWTGSESAEINNLLAAEALDHSNVVVVDWAAVATAHPGYLIGDRLHHAEAGEAAFVGLLIDAVSDCLTSRTG